MFFHLPFRHTSKGRVGRKAFSIFQFFNPSILLIPFALVALQASADTPYEVDNFTTPNGKKVQFTALTHASIRLSIDGTEIMIDPVSKRGKQVIDYSEMPKADYILVTHEHGDHCDKAAVQLLSTEQTKLIANKRSAEKIGYGQTLGNGEGTTLSNGVIVDAVPAYNYTEGHEKYHPKERGDNGYVLTYDGMRIYIAGDTEDIPEMAQLKDIDIAFLPCNRPTMTLEQLVKAAQTIKPKVLFPYHYGNTDVSGLPDILKKDGIEVRIRHYE